MKYASQAPIQYLDKYSALADSNTTQNNWEKQLINISANCHDRECKSEEEHHVFYDQNLKSFIRKLLSDARREVIEEIEKLQKDFRAQASKLPQYREAGMGKVFYFEGDIENELDVAFLKYIKIKLATLKEETK